MKPHEMLICCRDHLIWLLIRAGFGAAAHPIHGDDKRAETHISVKSGDGTKVRTYKIEITLVDEF